MTNRAPLIGQTTLGHLPGVSTQDRIGALLRAKARHSKAQLSCDIGLFGSDRDQMDLLDMEMFHDPTNEE